MMTLKLVSKDGRVRLIEAASFTVTEEGKSLYSSRKISAHDLPVGADDCWWVGEPAYPVESYRVFEVAYFMNSNGKTVETLQPPLNA